MKKNQKILIAVLVISLLMNIFTIRYSQEYIIENGTLLRRAGVIQNTDQNGRVSYVPLYEKVKK